MRLLGVAGGRQGGAGELSESQLHQSVLVPQFAARHEAAAAGARRNEGPARGAGRRAEGGQRLIWGELGAGHRYEDADQAGGEARTLSSGFATSEALAASDVAGEDRLMIEERDDCA